MWARVMPIMSTLPEAMALAVMRLHQRFGDEPFGSIKNWDRHEKETTTLRDRLAVIHEEMLTAYSGADIIIDTSTTAVTAEEKGRGLCRISFRLAEGLSPQMGDWPRELVAAVAANTPKKPKRVRMKAA